MFRIILSFILLTAAVSGQQKNVVHLSWDNVVGKSLDQNLSLRSLMLDYDAQNLEVWRAYSNFLPTLQYTGIAIHNLELPVLVFMGQRFQIGTNYAFQHSLDLNLPLFTGGSRFFNISAQQDLRKSLSEELKGAEQQTVLDALQAFFGILLADSLVTSARQAVEVAEVNMKQVEVFHAEGTATQLDLQRARAQYYSVIPQLETAESNRLLAHQRLKMLLDMPLEDSLVISDELTVKDFLDELKTADLDELKDISEENNASLKAVKHRLNAVETGERLSLSQFSPVISISGSLQHQAFSDDSKVAWKDYIRSKALTLSVMWPLFEGGRRVIDYQLAKIRTEQMELLVKQSETGVSIEVEQNFYRYNEAVKSLKSLEEAMKQSKESLRISNLLYAEGMSTQLDVLNAQLFYNSSQAQYLQGVYNYNINQLSLLKSVGRLNKIWNSK